MRVRLQMASALLALVWLVWLWAALSDRLRHPPAPDDVPWARVPTSALRWQPPALRRAAPAMRVAGGADGGEELSVVRVAGRVVEGSQPAGGAEVLFADRRLTADADGRFELELRPGDRGELLARRGEALSQVAWVSGEWPPLGEVTLVLQPGAHLRGVVRERDSRALVPGAVLHLERVPGAQVAAGPDGKFELRGVPRGLQTVVITAPGHRAASYPLFVEAGTPQSLLLVLDSAAAISGRVVNERGEPAPGVRVEAHRVGPSAEVDASTTTDARGQFRFEGLLSRAHRLSAHAEGFPPARVVTQAPATDLELRLGPGVQVQGEVVDSRGEPLQGARVLAKATRIRATSFQRNAEEATTDARGHFVLRDLDPGPHLLRAMQPGAFPSEIVSVVLEEGARREVTLRLPVDRRRIQGRMLDERSGAPIPDAWLRMRHGNELLDVEAGPDGAFALANLPEGRSELIAGAPGYAVSRHEVEPDGPPLELRLARTWWVTGRVVGDDGTPLPRFSIGDRDFEAADGRFRYSPPEAKAQLIFTAAGHRGASRDVSLLPGRILDLGDVVLGPGPEVTVKVEEPDGKPAAAAWLYLLGSSETSVRLQMQRGEATFIGLTDEAGTARLRLSDGSFCIAAALWPYPPTPIEGCPLTAAQRGPGALVVRFRQPAWVEGAILDEDGSPRVGIAVMDEEEQNWAISGPDGRYRLGPLTPGTLHVLLLPGGLQEAERDMVRRELTVAPGETVTVDLAPVP